MFFSLFYPFASDNFVSPDRFGRPVPRQAESGAHSSKFLPLFTTAST